MPPIVTLTTDFGEREAFVAALKGVLYSGCPDVRIADLSHHIARGDLMEGALFLASAVPHFPKGTVHLVNVAPGPAPIVVSIAGQRIVCPDNGVVTVLAGRHEIEATYAIRIPAELRSRTDQIFFSREVFAPVAARLAAGVALEEIGEPFDNVTLLDVPQPGKEGDRVVAGRIIHVDRFGNLLTNIHRSCLDGLRVRHVDVGHFPVGPLSNSYEDVAPGKPLALIGASEYLEIAYNADRADARLQMGKGIIVRVTVEPDD